MPDPALPEPFRWEGEHIAADLPGGRVLFSTRRGGVSSGPFASLNLGRLTDDDGANVDENRERLAAAVGLPRERFLYGRQVHGATVRRATEPPGTGRPAPRRTARRPRCDGRRRARLRRRLPAGAARRRRRASRRCTAAGAGSRAGSSPRASRALRELGADGAVTAAIGPGARGCCYEVGEEVHAAFAGVRARARASATSTSPRSRAAARGGRRRRGPRHRPVHDLRGDELFFSHRRDGGVTGRQAGVVWRA